MSYSVIIQPSGHTFEIDEGETVLDGALRHGIMLPYSCRGGSCGTCFGQVLSGNINFPDGLPLGLMESDQDTGKALFCVATATSDITIDIREVRRVQEIEVKTLPAKVISTKKLAPDVMEIRLALPPTQQLIFRAGQYIDFLLRNKRRRSFSIANASMNDGFIELHIRHIKGGEFTSLVFDKFHAKTLVRIEAPLGNFYIREEFNRPLILIAGGTGFAPIKGMIEQLRAEQDTRPVYFYWGVRAKIDLYHLALAESWAREARFKFIPVLSAPSDDDQWQGRKGNVHEAVADDFSNLFGYDVYVAGPPPMIIAATKAFIRQGLPREQLFTDSFEFSQP